MRVWPFFLMYLLLAGLPVGYFIYNFISLFNFINNELAMIVG